MLLTLAMVLVTLQEPGLQATKAAIQQKIAPVSVPAPDFDKEILIPLRQKQEADRIEAERVAEEAERLAEVPAVQAVRAEPSQPAFSGLLGTLGYALPYGNCVLEPGVSNPGFGNPIDWPVLSLVPHIGSTALFSYNHVGVVAGIWGNGDLEIRHQNCPGCGSRFPVSAFRGFR